MKNLLILSLAMLSLGNSCKEDVPDTAFKEGVIFDTRSPAVDGCGWIVKVDTISYSPVNLPDEFNQHAQVVFIRYEVLDEIFTCGYPRKRNFSKIKILDIKPKL